METTSIRLARTDELATIQDIEIQAGQLFREVGMNDVADHEPDDLETLQVYLNNQQLWVAVDPRDTPIGFIMTKSLDGHLYISEVSVHPSHGKKGVGRALMNQALDFAAAHGFRAVTLSTFRHIPWNAPFYEKLGFIEVSCTQLGNDHIKIQKAEAEMGLDMAQRVFMWHEARMPIAKDNQ